MIDPTTKRNRLIINLLLISAFVVILNETVMGVAIPHLMKDFGITALAAQWLTTAFLLTMAIVIPTTGFLIRRISTRRLFVIVAELVGLIPLVYTSGIFSLWENKCMVRKHL